MDQTPLFQQIAETLRLQIVMGELEPDAPLPPIREMAERWDCSPGTVRRAYNTLSDQGLIVSRPGAGTRVAGEAGPAVQPSLQRARLINQTEGFVLSAMSSGYTVEEITQAVFITLDRWRALNNAEYAPPAETLRFIGSHDPALTLLAHHLNESDIGLEMTFAGSLGGLMALARREAHIAGAHLWDARTETYNRPFVRRLLPGQRVALLTLAHRHIGLIVAPGNPHHITGLSDLTNPEIRFINRQPGAGIRVWLDAHLTDIDPAHITGYGDEVATHAAVAAAVNDGRADCSVGIEAAARRYGLDFIALATEPYDLVIPEAHWQRDDVQILVEHLDTMDTAIDGLGGYDTSHTGHIEWIT